MSLRIVHKTLTESRWLEVSASEVTYFEASAFGSKKRFPFAVIACVLIAEDGTLSFQVGREVFSIRAVLDNKNHQAVIADLVKGVRGTLPPPP